jgi:hypothetical protein
VRRQAVRKEEGGNGQEGEKNRTPEGGCASSLLQLPKVEDMKKYSVCVVLTHSQNEFVKEDGALDSHLNPCPCVSRMSW